MAAKVGMSGLQPGSIGVVGGVPQIGTPPAPAVLGAMAPAYALPPPPGGGGGGGGGEDPLAT
jgi:hypothetical protein